MNRGLYIHIPFCKQKCNYCDFNSGPYREEELDSYVTWLEKEATLYEKAHGKMRIETVFIGGGTPTVLDVRHIEALGNTISNHFDLSECVEFTFEANPESVTEDKAAAFKAIGANRVSIGLQTANDTELIAISRIHDWQTFLSAFRTFRNTGFSNINIDLMIGLPGQTKRSYMASLEKVLALSPEHISTYGLILEEGTPLESLVSKGTVTVLEPDAERSLYHDSKKLMESFGYKRYEISNFAKETFECRHNIKYWECDEYVALGVGAHGYLKGQRYENADTREYYKALIEQNNFPIIESETIEGREIEKEFVMLALRMTKGIVTEVYKERFGVDPFERYKASIQKWSSRDLLEINEGFIRLCGYGMDISNTIIIDFLDELDER